LQSGGIFIVDPMAAKNKCRLLSTRSNFIVTFPKSVSRLVVLNNVDSSGFHRVRVEFADGQSPLEDGATSYSCFIVDDPAVRGLLHYHSDQRGGGKKGGKGAKGGGKVGGKGGK